MPPIFIAQRKYDINVCTLIELYLCEWKWIQLCAKCNDIKVDIVLCGAIFIQVEKLDARVTNVLIVLLG